MEGPLTYRRLSLSDQESVKMLEDSCFEKELRASPEEIDRRFHLYIQGYRGAFCAQTLVGFNFAFPINENAIPAIKENLHKGIYPSISLLNLEKPVKEIWYTSWCVHYDYRRKGIATALTDLLFFDGMFCEEDFNIWGITPTHDGRSTADSLGFVRIEKTMSAGYIVKTTKKSLREYLK